MGMVRTSAFADGMDKFADDLDVSYSAGNNVSKSMGSYAYAASSSRAFHAVGNVAANCGEPMMMNCVMDSMVQDFSKTDVDAQTTTSDDTTNQTPSVGYTKTRSSK